MRVLTMVLCHEHSGMPPAATGFWLPELAHLYAALTEGGIDCEIASARGGLPPLDPQSDPRMTGGSDFVSLGFLESPVHYNKLLSAAPADSVQAGRYTAACFIGGRSAAFECTQVPAIIALAQAFWERGDCVAAIGYGMAALLEIRERGTPAVRNRRLADPAAADDSDVQATELRAALAQAGASFEPRSATSSRAVVARAGRLVTGEPRRSGCSVGAHLVRMLTRERPA